MEREIMKALVAWKNRKSRKPLLLTGVRQCGKTYVCKQFGEKYFDDVAYFYFEGNKRLSSVFEYDFDVERIIDELGNVIRGKKIVPGKTLVIFDEIQACPAAVTSLKYFCENKRELHIVCAGSLLGVSVRRAEISFPVGKVDRLQMYPMSFSEFLCANGETALLDGVARYALDEPLPELYAEPLSRYLKQYYIVGGMPEIVDTWIKTHNYEEVDALQDSMIKDYESDFAKYAPLQDVPKLGWIWASIPKQLAKENNKFMFSHVKEGKRSRELEDALGWLVDAGLVYRLELVATPELPLAFQADASYFKVYLSDIGLLRKLSGVSSKTILEPSDLYKNFKGALTENYVLLELLAQEIRPYFWRSGNAAELDFIFEHDDRIFPVEAKAEVRTRAKSFRQYCSRFQPEVGFRFSMKNVGASTDDKTKAYSLPLYLIWRLPEYLKDREQ